MLHWILKNGFLLENPGLIAECYGHCKPFLLEWMIQQNKDIHLGFQYLEHKQSYIIKNKTKRRDLLLDLNTKYKKQVYHKLNVNLPFCSYLLHYLLEFI